MLVFFFLIALPCVCVCITFFLFANLCIHCFCSVTEFKEHKTALRWNKKCYLGEPGDDGEGRSQKSQVEKFSWWPETKQMRSEKHTESVRTDKWLSSQTHTFWYTQHIYTHSTGRWVLRGSPHLSSPLWRHAKRGAKRLTRREMLKKKKEKFAGKWIPQAEPMHQHNGDTTDKTKTSERRGAPSRFKRQIVWKAVS